MNITKEEKKKEAIKRMKELDIIPDAIKQFTNSNTLMVSEPPFGGLYWLDKEQKEMVRKFEEEYNALVYMVVRSHTQFGMTDSLLYISDYKEEWEMDRIDLKNNFVMTYSINHDNPIFSEFGSIIVKQTCGGLIRIG